MSGNESIPKADSGQERPEDQRPYRDDDPNAVVQLAEALTQQLQAIAAGYKTSQTTSTTPSILDTQQVRLTTRYGALSNTLGNFGRHGVSRTGILTPPPLLINNETKLTFAAPIPGAANVVTFDANGNLLERKHFNANGVTVANGQRIQTVEIENGQGITFLFGFVARPVNSGQG
jgi:hypothetical protein